MSIRTTLTTLLSLVLATSLFAPAVHALDKPVFLDSVNTSEDFVALLDEEKHESRVYLAEKAVQDEAINITRVVPILNTSSYKAGDNAQITLHWESPMIQEHLVYADDIPSLKATVSLLTQDDVLCAQPTTQVFSMTDTEPSFTFGIIENCLDPKVSVTIATTDDQMLGTWGIAHPPVAPEADSSSSSITITALLILVGAVILFVLFRGREVLIATLFLLIFFLGVEIVDSDTFNLDFSASPTSVMLGGNTLLEWKVSGAQSCWASGGWSGWITPASGSMGHTLEETTTYYLECWDQDNTLQSDCSDGVDNDQDGYIDGYDSDCGNAYDTEE